MKILGSLILCLSLSLTGLYASYLYRKRIELLQLLSEFFGVLGELASLLSVELSQLIMKLTEDPRFSSLTFLCGIANGFSFGCNIKELWESEVKNGFEYFLLDKHSKQLLSSFSCVFGKYTGDEFYIKCREYSQAFSAKKLSEEKKWEKNRSLVSLSGVLSAAVLLLILM